MKKILLHQFEVLDNDIYMLGIVSNNIVINNNYTGIQILDSRLNLVRCIELFDDIAIYSLYKHHSNNEIILYCPENECLVHVNLDSGDFRKIELDNQFSEVVFSSIYLWKNEEVMFTDYRGHFYRLCIESGTIRTVDLNSIRTCYTSFYRFWAKVSKYKIISLYENGNADCMLFKDDHQRIGVLDYQTNKESYVKPPNHKAHEIIFRNGLFALIQEVGVILLKDDECMIEIKADPPFSFLRARFIADNGSNRLVTLSSNRSDTENSILSIYDIYV
ncbi:hypothetical protein J2Z48_003142 [Croceifilum oryzae]|uniref:Uncharacterized protein n=1 Tax=Croceifilum oryzae TaxID=1553429 RepID=A0AAJ1TLW2_9BACL|nr:hypothetical protein [Croceifilum oryzae]MDQ0418937.1 hypothetical protein [Croceifilum oryzae]